MTDNAAENVAAAHNDALLCLDEIGQANGKVVDEMTYMIANGHPKGRMTKTLGDQRRKLWRTVAMSTGETSIDSKIREQFGNRSAKAGQLVRFVEVAADAGAGKGLFEQLHDAASANEFARELKGCASANYVHAANAFIAHLVQADDRCKTRLEEFQNQFITTLQLLPDADGQVFRVADKFAVFAAAGELAIEAEILPWNAGTAITACAKMFNEWIEARGTSQSLEKQQHIALIKHFIQTHGDTRFATVEHDTVGFGKRDCVGMIKTDAKNKKVYHFFKESWEQVVCAGYNPIGVACSLHEAGFLDKGSDRWAKNVRIAGTQGYARYYVVKDTILNDGQDVEPPSKLNERLARLL